MSDNNNNSENNNEGNNSKNNNNEGNNSKNNNNEGNNSRNNSGNNSGNNSRNNSGNNSGNNINNIINNKPKKKLKKKINKPKNNKNENININLNNSSLSNNENINLNESNNNISHLISSNNENNSNNNSSNNSNNNSNNNNNKKENNINEDTKKFIENVSNKIKDASKGYLSVKEKWDDTSILIKILNIGCSILLTFYFSYIYFSLPLSIIFFILSFCILFIFNKLFAFMYLAIYIIIMVEVTNSKNIAYGNPLKVTDLYYTKSPLDCTTSSSILTVDSKEFQKELQLGNTTYSFWIYVNGSNNTVNQNTWNTYRYKEWKSIMYRGDSTSQTQFPGFWLTPTLNNLVIAFQHNNSKVERIQLDNIEMNKWINIITVIENKSVSIYIDGLLDRINNLDQTQPDVSTYNLYINNDYTSVVDEKEDNINVSINKNGFPGYLTNVINYNYPLTANYIKEAYSYYKKVIDNYQIKLDNKNNTYNIPSLITNSDIKT
jgi:hypothetical protein